MYKVLLADDDMLDLEGMRSFIPWIDLELEVVDAVNNGYAALEVLDREMVDILVTDVRMPSMSGLELARTAMGKYPDLKVIFVSGHQDFQYVKQAISMNACSYVLKPMVDAEMIESLQKTVQDMDMENKRRKTETAYKKLIPIVHHEYLLRVLEGGSSADDLRALIDNEEIKPIVEPVRVAVVEIDDLSWKLNPFTNEQRQELLEQFGHDISIACQQQHITQICKITRQRLALLLEGDQVADSEIFLKDMIAFVEQRFPFTVTIGLSHAGSLPEVSQSYQQATKALDYKMFEGKGKLISYETVPKMEIEEAQSLEIGLDALFSAMQNYELVRIDDEIKAVFHLAKRLHSRFTIHNFAMYIILKLDGSLNEMNENLFEILGMELENLDILLQFETIDDILSWLRRRLFEISEMLHQKKQKKNWKLVKEMKAFMVSRLADNFTMRDMSERFSFSPNYLGLIFKEETGKNCSEYMIELRMNKACELLRTSDMKIYEIAEQVGYRYLPYFSKQFRETLGMTPMDYRRER